MISDVVPPTDDALFVLESCHSTWIFDTDRMRFRRVLKGLALDAHAATTAWRAYYGLEIDPISESFVVLLNPEGTRLLRSWRHVEHCPQCGGNQTAELSLDELQERLAGLSARSPDRCAQKWMTCTGREQQCRRWRPAQPARRSAVNRHASTAGRGRPWSAARGAAARRPDRGLRSTAASSVASTKRCRPRRPTLDHRGSPRRRARRAARNAPPAPAPRARPRRCPRRARRRPSSQREARVEERRGSGAGRRPRPPGPSVRR